MASDFSTSSAGSGPHYCIWAEGNGSPDAQVRGVVAQGIGNSSFPSLGLYGEAYNYGSGSATGVEGWVSSIGTGTHYGVYGVEDSGGDGAAVYAAGDFAGSGGKYAVVKTTRGHRLLSVIESPEVWFEDFGEGQLVDGRATVELDPLFLETVTIDADHPMKVFVQLNDENCKGVAVRRGMAGFDVIELLDGRSNAAFSYRVVAKRRGYEDERLRGTNIGKEDPNLYPELLAEIERRHVEERRLRESYRQRRELERRKQVQGGM